MTVGMMIPNALGYFKRFIDWLREADKTDETLRNTAVGAEDDNLWRPDAQAVAASEIDQILRTFVSSWSWRALTHGE
jgi:hypothetical protein